jgi:hypothetical protein
MMVRSESRGPSSVAAAAEQRLIDHVAGERAGDGKNENCHDESRRNVV